MRFSVVRIEAQGFGEIRSCLIGSAFQNEQIRETVIGLRIILLIPDGFAVMSLGFVAPPLDAQAITETEMRFGIAGVHIERELEVPNRLAALRRGFHQAVA